MENRKIVTSFIVFRGKVLILKRSRMVGSYKGKWAGVSGYIEGGETPLEAAIREIREETGLGKDKIKLIREGMVFEITDKAIGKKWVIHPFLFRASTDKIRIDWEHSGFEWIEPGKLKGYDTVPGLESSLKGLLGPEAIYSAAGNDSHG